MFPTAKDKLLSRIDRERRSLELQGIRAAYRFGTTARQHAYAAWRTTRDPRAVAAAVRAVLLGSPKLHLPGISPLVKDGMIAAHLTGVRRTGLNVRGHVEQGIRLSSAYDGAIEFLRGRLDLTPDQLSTLESSYGNAASRVTQTASRALEEALQKALIESVEAGDSTSRGMAAMQKAFESQGFTPSADYQLQAIFRTQTNMAYSAGRWQSLQAPELADLVWGFEYSAILDDRSSTICPPLDGIRRPMDDPFWQRYMPPNHYNCRSTALEIVTPTEATAVPADIAQPATGFAFNPGNAFASLRAA